MKILLATPAFGGQISSYYVLSLIPTLAGFREDNIDFSLMVISNESLINRARNNIANTAIEHNFDKVMWIDADISWNYSDIRPLLLSDKQVVGGTYPVKTLPISLNFNPLPEHMDKFSYRKSVEELSFYKEIAPQGEVEVLHIPTGFLCVDTSVFRTIKEKVPHYTYRDLHDDVTIIPELFPVRVKNNVLESEDWAFCSLCRDNGIPVYFNHNVLVSHTGNYVFSPS